MEPLRVALQLLHFTQDELRFGVTLENPSSATLVIPEFDVTSLRFRLTGKAVEQEWLMTSLETFRGLPGIVLYRGLRQFEFRLRSHESWNSPAGTRTWRSGVYRTELAPGRVTVRWYLRVTQDTCAGSGRRWSELHAQAEAERAKVWEGEASSNVLQIMHP